MDTVERIARTLDPVSWKRADENPYQAPEVTGTLFSLNAARKLEEVIPPDYEGMVREFHEVFDHPRAERPKAPSSILAALRVRLIEEELQELVEDGYDKGNLVEIADAIGDILYVTFGAAIVSGIPIGEVFRHIHESNMSKLGADGRPMYRQTDGKVIKGPNYFEPKPKIAATLEAAANKEEN